MIDILYPKLICMKFDPRKIEWTITLSDRKVFKNEYLFECLKLAVVFYRNKKRQTK